MSFYRSVQLNGREWTFGGGTWRSDDVTRSSRHEQLRRPRIRTIHVPVKSPLRLNQHAASPSSLRPWNDVSKRFRLAGNHFLSHDVIRRISKRCTAAHRKWSANGRIAAAKRRRVADKLVPKQHRRSRHVISYFRLTGNQQQRTR